MQAQITDLITTGIAFVQSIRVPLAVAMGVYMVWTLFRRTQTDTDPSYRKFTSNAFGSMSFLISGAYVTMGLAAGIALLTWPLVIEAPAVGVALAVGVTFHAVMEKREDMEAAS